MADDGKRTEVLCTKVTERVALDLLRAAAADDRSPSEFMYLLIRRHLYGHMVRQGDDASQSTGVNKVDRGAD